ncbi:MAG: copper homeostasis protein CutC [Treponemataceae bacterium]|nr:MAG: copper homeostasis protein CutC [Treponemataceae bacterium]
MENNTTKILVEICSETVAQAQKALHAGADRIEFVSALVTGGVTPSIGALRLAVKTGVPIAAMLRARGGNFFYEKADFETMLIDAPILAAEGACAVVLGLLNADSTIDIDHCGKIAQAVKKENPKTELVFHRAFDQTPDWKKAIETLADLGFSRILSSGQADNAELGSATLREMQNLALQERTKIEILAGGGVRASNAKKIIAESGITQVHFSQKKSATEDFTEDELRNIIAAVK